MNAKTVRLGFDQFHHVRWSLFEEVVATLKVGQSNLESAWKTTRFSADLAEACVNSLRVGATWSVFPLEEPQVGSALAIYLGATVLVVGE